MRFTILEERSWFNAFRTAGRIPTDLVGVLAYVAVAAGVVLVLPVDGPLRVLVTLPLALFLPGYALLSVLFPRRGGRRRARFAWHRHGDGGRRIDLVERLALSFGTSLALVPLVGLAIAAVGWSYDPGTITLALGTFVVVGMVVGTVRRLRRPPEERFRVPVGRWLRQSRAAARSRSRRRTALGLALAVVVVASLAGFAYAVVAPGQGGDHTSVTLLGEDEDGDRVAGGYPTTLDRGTPAELVLAIENREGRTTDYTTVIALERVTVADGDATVEERAELRRFEVTVDDGVTAYVTHTVAPTMAGEDLRLSYYVYEGTAPGDPSPATAYRHTYVWVNVSA